MESGDESSSGEEDESASGEEEDVSALEDEDDLSESESDNPEAAGAILVMIRSLCMSME